MSCAVDIAVDSFYQNCFLFVAALVVLHCESGFTNTVQCATFLLGINEIKVKVAHTRLLSVGFRS